MNEKLGKTARDRVTGISGTVTAVCENLNGLNRIMLENVAGDGQPKEHWFYEDRLEITEQACPTCEMPAPAAG